MPAWPIYMPQLPVRDGLDVTTGDNIIRGPSDVGSGSRRKRYSSRNDVVSFPLPPVSAQVFRNFMQFYKDDLANGAKSFTYFDTTFNQVFDFYIDEMSYSRFGSNVIFVLNLTRKT